MSHLAVRAGAVYALLALTSTVANSAPLCRNGEPAIAELFTGWWCPICADARLFLYRHGVPFAEYGTEDDSLREQLFRRSGRGTIPAIYICRKWVFGFGAQQEAELRELLNVRSARIFP
jgi:glutaredoxin